MDSGRVALSERRGEDLVIPKGAGIPRFQATTQTRFTFSATLLSSFSMKGRRCHRLFNRLWIFSTDSLLTLGAVGIKGLILDTQLIVHNY